MRILDINTEEKLTRAIRAAVTALRANGVIVLPTETSYGLCSDPKSLIALHAIYRIKNRETAKALPLVACDLKQVQESFSMSSAEIKIAEAYWPGPLTILLKPRSAAARNLFRYVTKDGAIAIRVSSHPFVQAVTQEFGFPITATSANISGEPPCLSGGEVVEAFADQPQDQKPDLLINGGNLSESRPSTIIRVCAGGEIRVIRQGAIAVEPL